MSCMRIGARGQTGFEVIDLKLDLSKIDVKPFSAAIGIPLGVGALSSLLTKGSMEDFSRLRQPPLSPPDWVFPVVWSGLYVLMGAASYLVYKSDLPEKTRRAALAAYGATLVVNFLWPLLFFRAGLHLAAFLLLLLLLGLVCLTTYLFACIRPLAGKLLWPYIAWLLFAGYLNFGVYWLNR